MKNSLWRRGAIALTALGVAAGPLLIAAPAAHAADVPAGQLMITAAGSDTTMQVMNQIMPIFDNTSVQLGFTGAATTVRTTNMVVNPDQMTRITHVSANGNAGQTINGDAECPGGQVWHTDTGALDTGTAVPATLGTAPFGSGAGKNYLKAEVGASVPGGPTKFGCVDVARSSSGQAATDAAGSQYYAFALDSVSWATTSAKAPPYLTRAQLVGIYDCTIVDWGAIPGGLPGPIQRYYPQDGSGTRSFFSTDVLGKASTYAPPTAAVAGGACTTDPIFIEENEAQQVAANDNDKAIFPYSAAVW